MIKHHESQDIVDQKLCEERSSLAEHYLDIACKKLSAVGQAVSKYGDMSLSAYVQQLFSEIKPGYQKRDDLIEVVRQYAGSLLGEAVGQRVANDLAEFPVVLTANHHGVDYFSQSIQGSLIFSLNILKGAVSATTVPVFSCGNVPLNNLTYPRGALLYNINCNEIEDMPKKLPLFSNRMRKWMVSITPAFDYAMVQMAEAMLDKMVRNKQISSALAGSMHKMLQEDYCTGSVISLPNYSQQSTVLNNRIWKRLFSKVDRVPDIVYLEQEKIVGTLLESDLSNPESLAWCVMFDQLLSKQVLMELDGVKGCWKRIKLAQRLCSMTADDKILRVLEDCGTVFFWGIDQKGKRVPVCIETDTSDCKMLRGVDNRGDVWILPYTPQAVIEGLKNGKLIPSIFTNFLVLSFARGVICVGAYFQSEYLPAMQSGIVRALRKTNGYNNLADFVSEIPGDRYLSGMLAVMTIINNRCLVPAGPVEIIAGGGLTSNDFERILSLTVEDAHLAGLFETVPDSVQPAFRSSNWKHRLAEDCLRLLAQKVVIK